MNPYLLLSAAALVAAASPATAGKRVTNVSLDGLSCGELKLVEPQKGVFAVQYTNCGLVATGQGLARKTDQGKFVDLSDNYYGNYRSAALNFDLSLPLRTGGSWTAWIEFSGTTGFEINAAPAP